MKIDFKKEVLKRKEDIIKDLQGLIRINSELTTFDENRVGAPFGKGNKEALDYMLDLGKKDNFEIKNVDGYAGHIQYGNQSEYVAMMGHLDVVPAGTKWTYEPYGAQIVDGKMYGRGTEDDKGPTIAAYYAMKILKELDVKLSKRVKLILGLDEETGWRGVNYYFKKYPETPVSGFIPDADFPLIYAEKGIVRINVSGKINDEKIISFNGGTRDNVVPELACALILSKDDNLGEKFNEFLVKNKLKGNFSKENKGEEITYNLELEGVSAHGSTPDVGRNAICYLNEFLVQQNYKNDLTNIISKYFYEDNNGKKIGIHHFDDEMGDLTANLGVLETSESSFKFIVNVRYPKGIIFEKMFETIKNKFKKYNVTYAYHQELLYKDINSPLVQTLLNVYKKHTNDHEAKPISIGGGTFARALPNLVAYGPHFLSKPSYIHQPNEYIEIDDLLLATIIYTEALYELAK